MVCVEKILADMRARTCLASGEVGVAGVAGLVSKTSLPALFGDLIVILAHNANAYFYVLSQCVCVHTGREIGGGEIEIVKESERGTPRAVDQKVDATAAKHAQVLLHRRIRQPPFLGLVPHPQPTPFLVCEQTRSVRTPTHTWSDQKP